MSTAVKPAAETTIALPTVEYQGGAVMTPMAMIDRALASGATPDTLEKLLALQERWEASEARKAYNEALAAAKAEIRPVIKNRHVGYDSKKTGDRTEYDYEDLVAVTSMVDPILIRHGLSYRYTSSVTPGQVTVACILFHRMGHSTETPLSAPVDATGAKNAVQAIGSSVTYLQRYTLKLALGLTAAKDDDAQKASQADLAQSITAEQFQELQKLLEDSHSKEADMLKYVGAESPEDMTLGQYAKAKAIMTHKINSKKGGK